MATARVSVVKTAYTSLGTGPMLISAEHSILIVGAASLPAATTIGHSISLLVEPFYFPLAEQVWAIATQSNCSVTVTT
jgi:hypothetical protein